MVSQWRPLLYQTRICTQVDKTQPSPQIASLETKLGWRQPPKSSAIQLELSARKTINNKEFEEARTIR